jgi:hypothetical protein
VIISSYEHHLTFPPVEALVKKWRRARKGVEETGKAYEKLTSRQDSHWIQEWTDSAERAKTEGGETKKIYEITIDSGKP